jgi:hypothetical protein
MTSNNKNISQDFLLSEVSEKLLNALTQQGAITSSLKSSSQNDIWINVEELCNYLPDHPCRNTVYIWVSKRLIPFYKHSKHLYFRLAEIDAWIQSKRRMTFDEISNSVNKDMQSKLSGRKK